jgi:hypothetical protein
MDQTLLTAIEITRVHLAKLSDNLRQTPRVEQRLYMSLFSAVELGVGSSAIREMEPASRVRLYHVIAEEISAIYLSFPAPAPA